MTDIAYISSDTAWAEIIRNLRFPSPPTPAIEKGAQLLRDRYK